MVRLIKIKTGILWVLLFSVQVFAASELRIWTMEDGTTLEASYKAIVVGNVILEDGNGKQLKIKLDRFSTEDREFIELVNPPEFKIDFRKKSELLKYSERFSTSGLPVVQIYTFGIRLVQRSAGEYNHEVNIEFFAVAAQRHHNNKFILVDHQTTSFTPSKENKSSLEFWSPKTVNLEEYAIRSYETRGKKYDTYLIILTDKRGQVIATKTPNKWVLENLENLRKLSVGNFMDTTCTRVYPGRPKAELY